MDEAGPALPGEDLIRRGLDDLAAGIESAEALLVSIGAPRLTGLGLVVDLGSWLRGGEQPMR